LALDKQINLYSVDTGHFYSNYESYLHNQNRKYRQERNYIKNKFIEFEDLLYLLGYKQIDLDKFKSGEINEMENYISDTGEVLREYLYWNHLMRHKGYKARQSKKKLLKVLANKVGQNIISKGKKNVREIKSENLKESNIISLFESSLTRMIGLKQDELTDDLMVVQIYYFDVFKDIFHFGFTYNGEKYKYYTSSAGQIRKKKAVFIKESVWNEYEETIMCGLTIDKINEKGGNNVNKHLAYLALSNSATDEWKKFNIDKCIVIDDFETDVFGTYDFIDDKDYSIIRKSDYVPISHTDGAGMALPSLLNKNAMFRAPWIKGLLGVFDFIKMIDENNYSPVIKDIYGQEHDVVAENIQIIFTKSQFKMWKYYESWDDYINCYKDHKCTAGLCNIEENRIKKAKINYQMLQTLTNISDDEIKMIASESVDKLNNLCSSKENMMSAFGVTPYNTKMTYLQQAIKIYPNLLNDEYLKIVIRDIKDSLTKEYKSGKLEINGRYTFILPDYYAACEYWFGQIKQPNGLLSDGEVFCWLFKHEEKLDCLRSPHLYKEHAIRYNVANKAFEDRNEKIRKWFVTSGVYISSHDLISKVLQCDFDGDKSLVTGDQNFIHIAERNMNGIVPLYYNMRKAEPQKLNNENIYNGLNAAFVGGNIGAYSNDISKIWNSDVFINGSDKEKQEAINIVKILCMENNFCIDYAKTLYKPIRPKDKNDLIKKISNLKVPAFFTYAKDKTKDQVVAMNSSLVNKLDDIIPNIRLNFRKANIGKIDYRLLMKHPEIQINMTVIDKYDELNQKYHFKVNMQDDMKNNINYIAKDIREQLSYFGYSESEVCDMLVKYLYDKKKSKFKESLWFCYGKYIVENLNKNIRPRDTRIIKCVDCGDWIEVDVLNTKARRCESCQYEENKRKKREYWRKSKN